MDFPLRAPTQVRPVFAVLALVFILFPTGALAVYLAVIGQELPSWLVLPPAVFAFPVGSAIAGLFRKRPDPLVVDERGAHYPALSGFPAVSFGRDDIGICYAGRPGLVVAGAGAVRVLPARCFLDGKKPQDACDAILAVLGERADDVRARSSAAAAVNEKRPLAVYATAAVIALVFAVELVAGPARIVDLGAAQRDLVVGGGVWRMFSAPFLHAGALHLFMNGVALVSVGPVLERWLGRSAFLVILLVSALAGAVLSVGVHDTATVGISGGIFGLLGALLLSTVRYRSLPLAGPRLPLRSWLVLIGSNVVISLIPGVDGLAHLGGAAAGVALCALLAPRLADGERKPALLRGKAVVVVAAVVGGAYGASLLFMIGRFVSRALL